ncbi:uncharacterized protein LOC130721015 isoform X2 [Lotus japonicus]|uniref:Ubiquitin-like domain-containing protein n=1 Tax=Lotus japonicus TaxID=34305 RepID=I3TA04_LOTJA|nr:uncharacterized protein LOC130721015 isoform X2 [Lotus japonicus]AFK49346.1 unknown [Lotus japonicus]
MMDEPEELEPLFDYSRVQPLNNFVCLDDDEDEDVTCAAKKRKSSKPVENEKKETNVKGVEVVDIEDDDWLPPPPKVVSKAQRSIDEDSIVKKLRLKKQELVSFAESAEDLLKSVEESANLESSNSCESSTDSVSDKAQKPSERAKILISVQDKDGTKQIRMFMDDTFERIVKTYAEKIKCDLKQIVLSFDGDKISLSETPASLGMEDDDIIEVHVK